jgi:hypothetical protein
VPQKAPPPGVPHIDGADYLSRHGMGMGAARSVPGASNVHAAALLMCAGGALSRVCARPPAAAASSAPEPETAAKAVYISGLTWCAAALPLRLSRVVCTRV